MAWDLPDDFWVEFNKGSCKVLHAINEEWYDDDNAHDMDSQMQDHLRDNEPDSPLPSNHRQSVGPHRDQGGQGQGSPKRRRLEPKEAKAEQPEAKAEDAKAEQPEAEAKEVKAEAKAAEPTATELSLASSASSSMVSSTERPSLESRTRAERELPETELQPSTPAGGATLLPDQRVVHPL
jgi:hypothetical protein